MANTIILVDEQDNEIGTGEKMAVHRAGKLHRCFSIFVFNPQGQLLLQKRARGKYHSGGLWSNTCCGHPRPGENLKAAAERGLREEMGMVCDLTEKFTFTYRAELTGGITEHEIDHVFFGIFDGQAKLNPEEAEDWKWADLAWIKEQLKANPERYTVWLNVCFEQVLANAPKVTA